MMKEGKLFDENLSVASLTKIFARASSAHSSSHTSSPAILARACWPAIDAAQTPGADHKGMTLASCPPRRGSYTFELRVTNYLGVESAPVYHTVKRQQETAPSLALAVPSQITLPAAGAVSLAVSESRQRRIRHLEVGGRQPLHVGASLAPLPKQRANVSTSALRWPRCPFRPTAPPAVCPSASPPPFAPTSLLRSHPSSSRLSVCPQPITLPILHASHLRGILYTLYL